MLNWLIKSGEKTPSDIYRRGSVAWGNYYNVEFTYYTNTSKTTATKKLGSSTRIASGAYEGAKANNIYDLAGNVWLATLRNSTSNNGTYSKEIIGGDCSTTWGEYKAVSDTNSLTQYTSNMYFVRI